MFRCCFFRWKCSPVLHHAKQRRYLHEIIVLTRDMSRGTAPKVFAGNSHQASPNWLQLYIVRRSNKMRLVQDIGCEAPLSEMTPPTFAEVDPAGVPAMSLPDGACQSLDRVRNSDEMHVIRLRQYAQISTPCFEHHSDIKSMYAR